MQILVSRFIPTLHGIKVWCVPTHQLNALLQDRCGGLWFQCVISHLNTRSGVTKITLTSALLRFKVHMRSWSTTWLLSCQCNRRRIINRLLLLNWQITSKDSTPAWSRGNFTWRRIPEMRVKWCLTCLQLVLDGTLISLGLTTTWQIPSTSAKSRWPHDTSTGTSGSWSGHLRTITSATWWNNDLVVAASTRPYHSHEGAQYLQSQSPRPWQQKCWSLGWEQSLRYFSSSWNSLCRRSIKISWETLSPKLYTTGGHSIM